MPPETSPPNAHLHPKRPLILASASPRRRQLLAALGRPYESTTADIDERVQSGEDPVDYVLRMAVSKALAIATRLDPAGHRDPGSDDEPGDDAPSDQDPSGEDAGQARPLIIGSDTIVVHKGRILGKPADPEEATRVLKSLRNRRHLVHTGVAIVDPATGLVRRDLGTTGVWMRDYRDAEIEAYVASGDPMDKAGAYAIQHPGFRPVAKLEGSEANVIGLPLGLLSALVGRFDREP